MTEMAGVEHRLDVAVRLLAGLLTKGMTRKDAILTLSGAGLAPKEVAEMLGISANQVSVALYDAKQKAARPRRQPRGE
jgi:DNA-binding CsgD family transcriptional regulator